MKVAVVTDDMQTVSAHFGMARHYLVYELDGSMIKGKEKRDKAGHGPMGHGHDHARGPSPGETGLHDAMLSNVGDCVAVIARGMGGPMYESIRASGKQAFITKIELADDAVRAFAEGTLDNHPELLH